MLTNLYINNVDIFVFKDSGCNICFLIARKVDIKLDSRCIISHEIAIGHFCTSLEMSGFSITLVKLDQQLQYLYDLPCQTLGRRK
ncbi:MULTISPECIES: dihydroxyacetone kinase subunit DhaK [unclassified Gilliamella]|uniref:dihydroxyacetone kinase subunit DhaK n=1 Tax=unclassified Gilliamella TaxID=2685620 RepID=UPI0009BDE4E0|nr:dihydroxyacetone kinase subunit DhaK [Gilliamella sp. B2911]MCX8671656.1 dihydroxyacetone kinase subunit DhaK [Gilliamella sp. B2785]MCX8679984.1 dihydroxyacetone kinase subunit DhaK [Gilliamella sp. B2865]